MNTELWFLTLSCLCFVAGFISSMLDLRKHGIRHTHFHFAINTLGFVMQCAFLSTRGRAIHHCPFTTPYELLVFLAWSIMLIYFLSGSAFRLSLMGFFTAPLVLLLQGSALNFPKDIKLTKISPLTEWHAAVSLLSYGAFALAAVSGVMYILQDRLLKKHTLGELFLNLPPLHALGQALRRILLIGVILCTTGMTSAFFLPIQPAPSKLWLTAAIWAVYAILLTLFHLHRISPRTAALASALFFLVPLLSLSQLHSH